MRRPSLGRLLRPGLLRRASTGVLGVALLVLSAFAIARTVQLQARLQEEERRRATYEIATLVDLWEGLVTDRIASWITDLGAAGETRARVDRIRRDVPWFEAIAIWRPGSPPVFDWPRPPAEEDYDALIGRPCLKEALGEALVGRREEAARAFRACADEDPSPAARLLAASMSASLWSERGQPSRALAALGAVSALLDAPLADPPDGAPGESPPAIHRLITCRVQRIDALAAVGDAAAARREALRLVRDVATLEGPALATFLPTADDLRRRFAGDADEASRDADEARTRAAWRRAHRRLAGWERIRDHLARRDPPRGAPGDPAALEVLRGEDGTWLLVTGRVGDGRRVAAVQVDVGELLTALLEATPRGRARPDLVVLDATGRVLRGSAPTGDDGTVDRKRLVAEVPFHFLLPALRLGMVRLSETHPTDETRWAASQFVPIVLALLLGGFAIAGRVRADRRQVELVERQQAFIARVTHELKTPLAGIRVMAETLDLVGLEGRAQSFPRRIVREVERLDQRIEEVLTVARRPEVSARTPVEPAKLADAVVQHWRPRFEAVGARLDTDLRPCAPIAADPALLRDALNNLLDNALKYRRPDVPARVLLRAGESGRHVVFEVIDNGLGVPPAMRRRIFERFTRIEGAGRGKAGGYGLGLAFVAEAAAAHHGLVECLDGFDGGARFRIRIRRR